MLETSIQIGNTVYSSFILTFRRYSLHLFVIKNRPIRFISKKYFLGSFMKNFFKNSTKSDHFLLQTIK